MMDPNIPTYYLLFKKYKLAFVHIPRAGASSILEMIIRDECPYLQKHLSHKNKISKMWSSVTDKNSKLPDYLNPLSQTVPEDFKVFACVRNPFSRVFSGYHMIITRPDKQFFIREGEPFTQFICESLSFFRRQNRHFMPLQKLLEKAPPRTTFFRFEEYESSMNSILKEARYPGPLFHTNQNPGKLDYKTQYFLGLKIKVSELYKWDLDTFKYKFDDTQYGELPKTLFSLQNLMEPGGYDPPT